MFIYGDIKLTVKSKIKIKMENFKNTLKTKKIKALLGNFKKRKPQYIQL